MRRSLRGSIKSVELRQDWGFTILRPLEEALPDDFLHAKLTHIPIDRQRRVGKLPWSA
jgi:hypothetical protein